MFSFGLLRTNRTVVQKRHERKIQDKNRHWKGSSQKQKLSLHSLHFAKSSARDAKWIQSTKCLLWFHVHGEKNTVTFPRHI